MMKLCSAREYCKSDIYRKIEIIADPGVDIDEIIERLCKDKFLSEERYAEAFVKDKTMIQGWGEAKIRYTLRKKGLEERCIEEALQSLDQETMLAKMSVVLENKYKTLKGSDDEKFAKLYRFAVGRGFSYDKIKLIYDRIRSNKRD